VVAPRQLRPLRCFVFSQAIQHLLAHATLSAAPRRPSPLEAPRRRLKRAADVSTRRGPSQCVAEGRRKGPEPSGSGE